MMVPITEVEVEKKTPGERRQTRQESGRGQPRVIAVGHPLLMRE